MNIKMLEVFFPVIFIFYILLCSCSHLERDGESSHYQQFSKIVPVVDRDYFPAVKKLIRDAKESISISMFVAKTGPKVNILIKELKKTAKRDVQIKILLENNIDNNAGIFYALKNIRNISIKFDSPEKVTHNKIIIVDKEIILIGSTNWTESSLSYANEANVMIMDKKIAEYYQEYLDYLWEDSSRDISPFQNFDGKIIPIIDRQYFDVIKELMKRSNKRIYVMVYGYKLTETGDTKGDILAKEIIKAKARGVDTKVFLESSSFNKDLNKMNSRTIEYFKRNGVDAKFDKVEAITHSKVVIIDDAVILGATNWSRSGLAKWHNTDILIKEKEIVEFFVDYLRNKDVK